MRYPNTEYAEQRLASTYWADDILNADNGFARSLSISRDFGGTLYLSPEPVYIGNRFVKFSQQKFAEYAFGTQYSEITEGCRARVYFQHNVDHYPGALFLRNWAILYLNEALQQLAKSS